MDRIMGIRAWIVVWAALALLVGCPGGGITVPDDDDVSGDDDDDDHSGDDDDHSGDDDDNSGDDDDDAAPTDEDGDGWLSDEDCDDTDPDINPDAEEVADGIDNDCDGTIDTQFVCHDGSGHYEEIQEGIDLAPEGFTLEVCPGVYDENPLLDDKVLTIRGTDGPEVTIVDGNGSGQVWTVTSVGQPGAAIEGFTVVGGDSDLTGGGIVCDQSDLRIDDCIVEGNRGVHGGGILGNECALEITGAEVRDNVASEYGGGALLYQCSGSVSGSTFADNTAFEGGGLAVNGGSIEIEDNEIDHNETTCAEEYCGGGGVWLSGNAPLIDNTISANVSTVMGGGVYLYDSSGDVHGNLITDNVCYEDGAGLYSFYGSSAITENTFTYNEAWDDAGGLRIMTGTCVVEDNTISYNTAVDDGGGVKFSHSINEFRRNHIEGNVTGDEGGGFELDNDITPIEDCTFIDNQAGRGAGIHSGESWGDVWIIGTLIEGNVATDRGGAIQFEEDTAANAYVIHVTAVDNHANYGGAICVTDSTFTLVASVIDDNRASVSGGGVYIDNSSGDIYNLTVHDNQAPDGAGITVHDSTGVTVVNNIVADSVSGSGVSISGSIPTWSYNDVYGSDGPDYDGMPSPTGTQGNISVDASFFDPGTGDFTLAGNSPCVDSGTPVLDDETDGTRSDMGAYGGPYGSWP